MSPVAVASIAFACILGGAIAGLWLGRALPDHHLESNSKDVVRLAMAMIATMTALVLGLVTASAKSSFDTEDNAVKHTAATVLSLDRMLVDYGPQTKPIRESIRDILTDRVARIWPTDGATVAAAPVGGGERIVNDILALKPETDAQRWYQSRALDLAGDILQARWVVFSGSTSSIPVLFLVVIICWLTILFGSFGLFAPANPTVIGALLLCTLSVAASIFLILEMDDPFSGVMRISSAPMQYALSHIGR